jgi:hypothetical protein
MAVIVAVVVAGGYGWPLDAFGRLGAVIWRGGVVPAWIETGDHVPGPTASAPALQTLGILSQYHA